MDLWGPLSFNKFLYYYLLGLQMTRWHSLCTLHQMHQLGRAWLQLDFICAKMRSPRCLRRSRLSAGVGHAASETQ